MKTLSSTVSKVLISTTSNADASTLSLLYKSFSTSASVSVSAGNSSAAVLRTSAGAWTSPPPTCMDVTPPQFVCPAVRQLEYGPVVLPPDSLVQPTVWDNSEMRPAVVVQPDSLSTLNPLTGNVTINYTATDAAGNSANCSIQVQLVDTTPPTVMCPPSEVFQYVNISAVTGSVKAELPDIPYSDLGGIASAEYRGVKPNDLVSFGSSYLVQFVVVDKAGNSRSCNFVFALRSQLCDSNAVPLRSSASYASTACLTNADQTSCTLACPSGQMSALTGLPNLNVSCRGNASWDIGGMPILQVPDCSPVLGSLALDFNASYTPAYSSCTGTGNFSLNESLLSGVSCGFSSMSALRFQIRRLTNTRIDFAIVLEFNSTSVLNDLMTACIRSAANTIGGLNLMINSLIPGCNATSGPATLQSSTPVYRCQDGSVMYSLSSISICLPCPPGSYQNGTRCSLCDVGWFQSRPASLTCQACPDGTNTVTRGSSAPAMCRPRCMPGAFSSTGLEPCQACAIGSYSDKNASLACSPCPKVGDVTPGPGASDIRMCGSPCPAGYFGPSNGVNLTSAPCLPCPRHSWQNRTGQASCNRCPDGLATVNNGATSQSDCRVLDQCSPSPCLNGGTCANFNTFYRCNCNGTGFTGLLCDVDIDECAALPCMNGGNCTNLVNGYRCDCPAGYVGLNCGWQRDLCTELRPCQNGGTCTAGFNSYRCDCTSGFKDSNCSTPNDPCTNATLCSRNLNQGNCTKNGTSLQGYVCTCALGYLLPDCAVMMSPCDLRPCSNGGTCQPNGTTRSCACPPGLTGESCDVDIDESKGPNPCLNNGTVINLFGGYDCQCQAPFTGKNCSNQTNSCDAKPCLNGATCVNLLGVNNFTCQCLPGFTGLTCEIKMNPCNANPCSLNNTDGPCAWTGGSNYTCNCQPGWTGVNCTEAINPCMGYVCQNGGVCNYTFLSTGAASTFCTCQTGFTGLRCEINIDDCNPNPCVNGFCMDGVANYTCTCKPGWSGTNCDQMSNACDIMGKGVCSNGGTCAPSSDGSYWCVNCTAGWTGQNCSVSIDYCNTKPCLNGGICNSSTSGYSCSCINDFTGSTCESPPNYCISYTCQNGGTCLSNSVNRNATCNCNGTGFTGTKCEMNINDCPTDPSAGCQNSGVCIDGINNFTCACLPAYSGDRCEKGGSTDTSDTGNFDFSAMPTGGARASLTMRTATNDTYQELTLVANVRPTTYNGEIIRLSRDSKSVIQWSTNVLAFNNPDVAGANFNWTVSIGAGYWTNLVLVMNRTGLMVYINGTALVPATLPAASARVNLTSAVLQFGGTDGSFAGDLSQVNLFSSAFNSSLAIAYARNCTAARAQAGDLFSYRQLNSITMPDGFQLRSPSVCQSANCSVGFTGQFCTTLRDTEPPKIVYCPSYISVVNSDNRISMVYFREPEFSDNSGSYLVTKNYANGSSLTWGEYKAVYQATDPSGNSQICQFSIYVTRYNCESLVMPNDRTISVCATTPTGTLCTLSCRDEGRTKFVQVGGQPLPPFYFCDRTGSWFPPAMQSPYTLPGCEFIGDSPTSKASGNLSLSGGCDESSKDALAQKALTYLTGLGLCSPSTCSLKDFSVSCGGARRRRQASGGAGASVSYSVPSSGGISSLCTSLKGGSTTIGGTTTVTGSCPTITSACPAGQVLSGTTCILCPAGTYATTVSNVCVPCPIGQYSSLAGSAACTSCPTNKTTPGVGASDGSMCYTICPVGQYLGASGACQVCPPGTYSDSSGSATCTACPAGTFASAGSISSSSCGTCPAGRQLGADGSCGLCPTGYFREFNPNVTSCQACPSGYTTPGDGSVAAANCSVVLCPPGSYRNQLDNTCLQCPLGTFNPTAGQTQCLLCGQGNTSLSLGAVSYSQCVRGTVNECASVVWTWFCSPNAVCQDTADYFSCPCRKPNFVGEWLTCSCATGYSGSNCDVNTPSSTPSGLGQDAIIAIAVSCAVVAVAIIVGVTIYCVVRNKKKRQPSATYTVYSNEYAKQVVDSLNKGYQMDDMDAPPTLRPSEKGPQRGYMHSDFQSRQF